jgi:oxalate decarboxylase
MIISRRSILGTAAAGVVTAATANAQTSDIPQPERPGKGGTDIGPRDVIRDRENPDVLVPPATDSGTLPNLNFSLRMLSKYSF